MPPAGLPYALHEHLSTKPELRDWLQTRLKGVTIQSRRVMQLQLWRTFPAETLMIPTDEYPAFWTWDRATDARQVLLEMFGFERGFLPGSLTMRLREVSRSLAAFDRSVKPIDTSFSLQSAVIAKLLETENDPDVDVQELGPIKVGKAETDAVFDLDDDVKAVTQPVKKTVKPVSVPVPPMPTAEPEPEPEQQLVELTNALAIGSTEKRVCAGITSKGARCKFSAMGGSEHCRRHQPKP